MKNTVNITIIGFGEVGSIFARDFLARGDTKVSTYDIKFASPTLGPPLLEKARAMGVTPGESHAGACEIGRAHV